MGTTFDNTNYVSMHKRLFPVILELSLILKYFHYRFHPNDPPKPIEQYGNKERASYTGLPC